MKKYQKATLLMLGIASALFSQTSWTKVTSDITVTLESVAFGKGRFVAGGTAGVMAYSADGVSWTIGAWATTNTPDAVAFCNNQFVAAGSSGTIQTSSDGITWTSRPSGITTGLNGLAYGTNTYVVTGSAGTILTSINTLAWTPRTSGTTRFLMDVCYWNNQFVAVGDSGTILTSPNGQTWTARTSGTNYALFGAAYGGNQYVVCGSFGTILTSTNGIAWTLRPSGTTDLLTSVVYGNGIFVTVGSTGRILTSTDGVLWTRRTSGVTSQLRCVAYNGANQYVAAGMIGTIITSYSIRLLSAVASDNTVQQAGIDNDDWVLFSFSPPFSHPPVVTARNVDSLFDLNPGHSWLSGFGTITSAVWNPAGDKLLLTLNNTVSAPTVAVGDIVTWDTSRVALTGSFDPPVGVRANNTMRNPSTGEFSLYTLQGRIVMENILARPECLSGKNALYSRLPQGVYLLRGRIGNYVLSKMVAVSRF